MGTGEGVVAWGGGHRIAGSGPSVHDGRPSFGRTVTTLRGDPWDILIFLQGFPHLSSPLFYCRGGGSHPHPLVAARVPGGGEVACQATAAPSSADSGAEQRRTAEPSSAELRSRTVAEHGRILIGCCAGAFIFDWVPNSAELRRAAPNSLVLWTVKFGVSKRVRRAGGLRERTAGGTGVEDGQFLIRGVILLLCSNKSM